LFIEEALELFDLGAEVGYLAFQTLAVRAW
jgi:hypothetical protein